MKKLHFLMLASLIGFAAAPAGAQTPAAPAAPAAAAPATTPAASAAKPRSAKSLDCSKQADSQSLHGKARKSFMSKCKKS